MSCFWNIFWWCVQILILMLVLFLDYVCTTCMGFYWSPVFCLVRDLNWLILCFLCNVCWFSQKLEILFSLEMTDSIAKWTVHVISHSCHVCFDIHLIFFFSRFSLHRPKRMILKTLSQCVYVWYNSYDLTSNTFTNFLEILSICVGQCCS